MDNAEKVKKIFKDYDSCGLWVFMHFLELMDFQEELVKLLDEKDECIKQLESFLM